MLPPSRRISLLSRSRSRRGNGSSGCGCFEGPDWRRRQAVSQLRLPEALRRGRPDVGLTGGRPSLVRLCITAPKLRPSFRAARLVRFGADQAGPRPPSKIALRRGHFQSEPLVHYRAKGAAEFPRDRAVRVGADQLLLGQGPVLLAGWGRLPEANAQAECGASSPRQACAPAVRRFPRRVACPACRLLCRTRVWLPAGAGAIP